VQQLQGSQAGFVSTEAPNVVPRSREIIVKSLSDKKQAVTSPCSLTASLPRC